MCEHPKPSFAETIANLRRAGHSRRRFPADLLLIAWDRLSNRRSCCGDYGAPGC